MNDQFSSDSLTDSTNSTETPEKAGKGPILAGYLICGAVPALVVGFGAICYQTAYKQALQEVRPTIIHGNQTVNNQKVYQISPSIGIGSNNNR